MDKPAQIQQTEADWEKPLTELIDLILEYGHRDEISDLLITEDQPLVYKQTDQCYLVGENIPLILLVKLLETTSEGRRKQVSTPAPDIESYAGERVLIMKGRRFRSSLFRCSEGWRIVLRPLADKIPEPQEIHLPDQLLVPLDKMKEGLILLAGPMSHGKTTSAFSLLQHLIVPRNGHIATLEDPIELILLAPPPVPRVPRAIISQRERGRDFHDYGSELRSGLRQAQNVLFVGEIRDADTAMMAVSMGIAGHLVFATVHAETSEHALQRVIQFYADKTNADPAAARSMMANAFGILCWQMLKPHSNGQERVPIHEVIVRNVAVRNIIRDGKWNALRNEITMNPDHLSRVQSIKMRVDERKLPFTALEEEA